MKEFHSRLKNLCGVATLCAGAIFSLLSVAFMGIAFATNNWVHISVNRNELLQSIEAENDTKAIEEFQKGKNINMAPGTILGRITRSEETWKQKNE